MTIKEKIDNELKNIAAQKALKPEITPEELSNNFLTEAPNAAYKVNILNVLREKNEEKQKDPKNVSVCLFPKEIAYLTAIKDPFIKELFYSLILYQKINPHESNWIHFDFQNILRMIYSEKELEKIKREDFSKLVPYGLDFRVVGSKTAIPCYKLPDDCLIEPEECENLVPVYSFVYSEITEEENKKNAKKILEVISS